jgi:xanthine dehydrogenase YagS FAD-binding subunit
MNRFEIAQAHTVAQAQELFREHAGSAYKAGGIDLLDHLKEHLVEPPRLVDLKKIPALKGISETSSGGVSIGPLTTLAEIASHPGLRASHPALCEACAEAASPQIRNVATLGGNLLQRPRCWYYRLESYRCLKKGGDSCYAVNGENRYNVIFGGGPSWAAHPSNAAVALVAYRARLVVRGRTGERSLLAEEFFRLPKENPTRENVLEPGELLIGIQLPPATGFRSRYEEVREKAAFDWPLVSCCTVLRSDRGAVVEARVVLGAVAPIPWRVPAAERALIGRPLTPDTARAAAAAATEGAEPLSQNGYKVDLVRSLVKRMLLAQLEPA